MTAVRCAYCETDRPAVETFFNGSVNRCKDGAACEYRATALYDPTIVPAEDRPVPPPMDAPPGAACPNCGATEGLYGGAAWMCRDRAACEQRSVEFQYLTAWSDSSPDAMIAAACGTLQLPASHPPVVPAEQPRLDPAEMAAEMYALSAQEALGRKRPGR